MHQVKYACIIDNYSYLKAQTNFSIYFYRWSKKPISHLWVFECARDVTQLTQGPRPPPPPPLFHNIVLFRDI